MFAKLLAVIAVMVATACALLAARHERLEEGHRMAKLHRRLIECEQETWELERLIADRCRPEALRRTLGESGGAWAPVVSGEQAPGSPP